MLLISIFSVHCTLSLVLHVSYKWLLDGWMNGWLDEWMDELMDGWIDG